MSTHATARRLPPRHAVRRREGLPPGPRGPAAGETLRLAHDWVGFLQDCRRRYGDVFTVNFAGFGTAVYVADPDVCAAVFQGDPDVFRAGEAREVAEPIAGPRSVLILDGDEHRRERRRERWWRRPRARARAGRSAGPCARGRSCGRSRST